MTEEKYPHKILVVEDEPAMLDALIDNLQAAGFGHVLQARNGEDGLVLAVQEKPDLILLDIIMSKMDGMSMLKELRNNVKTRDIKVILLTNLTADDAVMGGVVANEPSYYLVKSDHSISDIVEKVKETLGIEPTAH